MARMEGLTLARGNRGLLLIALAAGLIAAVLVFAALAQGNDSDTTTTSAPGGTVQTVVAAQDIPPGMTITAEMVKIANVDEDLKIAGAYSETRPVVGQVTNYLVKENEAITPSKIGTLADGPTDGSFDRVVQSGQRGFALAIDDQTGVGGNLIPGNRVDVMAIFEETQPVHKLTVKTVLQNVEILAVDQEQQDPLPAARRDADGDGTPDVATSGQPKADAKPQSGAATITLSVTQEQAQILALVQEDATKVYTSLRAFGDQDQPEVPTAEISDVRP